jgi:hypothetical protein
MQSSAAVVLRALLMLICLIAIPLAALWGSSLPRILSGVMDGRWREMLFSKSSSAPAETSQFEPIVPGAVLPAIPAEPIRPNWQSEPLKAGPQWPPKTLDPAPSTVTPAVYEAQVGPAAAASGMRRLAAEAAVSPPPQPPAAPEQFTMIQERLRQLGATYYLLESWGNRQDLFRFYCKMAIGGNPNFTRHFEATDSEPLRAMALVLEQVETWRANR